MESANFFVAGVGGQGTLLASDIIALVGAAAGYDVKKSEVHGMSQRGGSVVSQVRWGAQVYAPLVGQGEIDYLISFEKLEALRYIEYLRPDGVVLVNEYEIPPVAVNLGQDSYPDDERIRHTLSQFSPHIHYLNALGIAAKIGNTRINNVVILGALSCFVDLPVDTWLQVIGQRVPERFRALNLSAFQAGREAMSS